MNPEYQQWRNRQDEDHLKLLVLFFRIYGGLCLLGICCFSFYVFMGWMAMTQPAAFHSSRGQNDAAIVGPMFTIIGAIGMLLAGAAGTMFFVASNWIQNRTNWAGIFAMAIVACLNAPVGTALGVFALVVLNRDSVKALFGQLYSGCQGSNKSGSKSEDNGRSEP